MYVGGLIFALLVLAGVFMWGLFMPSKTNPFHRPQVNDFAAQQRLERLYLEHQEARRQQLRDAWHRLWRNRKVVREVQRVEQPKLKSRHA